MDMKDELARLIREALARAYPGAEAPAPQITLPKQKDMGDYAAVLFPVAGKLGVRPQELSARLAQELSAEPLLSGVQAAGGFLNFRIRPSALCQQAVAAAGSGYGGSSEHAGSAVMVEYSSPNTNKPLHLGHIRNNVLGMSLVHLLEAVGYRAHPTCLVNDRGIHICKSMVAYQRYGNGETPASTGEKGDHFVGRYYVRFETAFREELKAAGIAEDEAARQKFFDSGSSIGREAREALQKWEEGDPAVLELWRTMNGWVYEGFASTYQKLGSVFEKTYYESDTFRLGNRVVDDGLARGVFFQQPDGSVWIDLEDAGLGKKLLRRKDGTSVYITQDLGTAIHKFEDFKIDLSIYVVGSEQIHHFQLLFEILRRMGYPWAKAGLFHMSYGMVYLPSGKMKSREGTVVDADDLLGELTESVLGKIRSGEEIRVPEADVERTAHQIAAGALKFYLLAVTPATDMHFDPEKSIGLQGDTGPSVQYAVARIHSIFEKAGELAGAAPDLDLLVEPEAVEVSKLLLEYPAVVRRAAEERNPALVAKALLQVKDCVSKFYRNVRVLEPGGGAVLGRPELTSARLALLGAARRVLIHGLGLLGIEAPAKM